MRHAYRLLSFKGFTLRGGYAEVLGGVGFVIQYAIHTRYTVRDTVRDTVSPGADRLRYCTHLLDIIAHK
jgi:hypothetical protein